MKIILLNNKGIIECNYIDVYIDRLVADGETTLYTGDIDTIES